MVELVVTNSDIPTMFHPALTWVDASSVTGVAEGWIYDGSVFSMPVIPEVKHQALTISEMQAQLAIFATQLAALEKRAD